MPLLSNWFCTEISNILVQSRCARQSANSASTANGVGGEAQRHAQYATSARATIEAITTRERLARLCAGAESRTTAPVHMCHALGDTDIPAQARRHRAGLRRHCPFPADMGVHYPIRTRPTGTSKGSSTRNQESCSTGKSLQSRSSRSPGTYSPSCRSMDKLVAHKLGCRVIAPQMETRIVSSQFTLIGKSVRPGSHASVRTGPCGRLRLAAA